MIAKLEWTQSNALQNKNKHRSPRNYWKYIKNSSTSTDLSYISWLLFGLRPDPTSCNQKKT